jgi:hypothetical protein
MASFPDRAMERQSNNIDVRTAIDHNGKNAPAPAVHGPEARQNLLKRTDSPPKACRYRAATAALSSRFGGHRGDAVLGVARFGPDQDAQGLGRQKWAMVLSRKMRLSRAGLHRGVMIIRVNAKRDGLMLRKHSFLLCDARKRRFLVGRDDAWRIAKWHRGGALCG